MLDPMQKIVREKLKEKSAARSKKRREAKKRICEEGQKVLDAALQKLGEASKSERGFQYPQIDEGPRTPGKPLWMPEGVDAEKLPVEIRQAVEEIVQPTYEQLVLNAAPGLERSLGASLVHLLWLEILDQFDIKCGYSNYNLSLGMPTGRNTSIINNHVHLLDAKLRHGKFMLQLEQFRQMSARSQTAQNLKKDAPPASPQVAHQGAGANPPTLTQNELKTLAALPLPPDQDRATAFPGLDALPIPLELPIR